MPISRNYDAYFNAVPKCTSNCTIKNDDDINLCLLIPYDNIAICKKYARNQ